MPLLLQQQQPAQYLQQQSWVKMLLHDNTVKSTYMVLIQLA